ncbi:MAG: DUF885 domain-containing protein [Pseudomonadota bacterium]
MRTLRKLLSGAGAALLAVMGAGAHAQTPDVAAALQDVIDAHWAWTLEQYPVFATSLGVRDHDAHLGGRSLAAFDAREQKTGDFLEQLKAIDADALSGSDKINYDLLLLTLEHQAEAAAFGGKYLLMSNRRGPHTELTGLADRAPFFTKADYESYVARLEAAPAFLSEAEETLRVGAAAGWSQPCAPMGGVEDAIRFHVVDDVSASVFAKPFAKKPASISARDWRRIKKAGEKAIAGKVLPALAAYADFYAEDYAPACREDVGASGFPDGEAYYAMLARHFTTTDKTPDEIHKLGLSEVARIRAEMMDVIERADFDGDLAAFQAFLRTDPQFYAKTPEELEAKTALISKRADGVLPLLFTRFPRMPYTVKPVPADIAEGTTTAYYERPAGDGSRAGVYRINTSLLDQRPLFELEALSLHEAVPGHHFQIALAQELDMPAFRRYGGFTAFTEGWGLYAESLGLDAGFYQDPYSDFGRLSYEMWRACRLVVDTGLHAKGWSKQEAMDYMAENTALSLHNIEAEVNRYIANPGQALAYKMGELKIQELRTRAAGALGADFDLRLFHDALLENGGVPLSVLEKHIDAWIAAEKAK